MNLFFIKHKKSILKATIAICAIVFVYVEGSSQIRTYNFNRVHYLLNNLSISVILILILLGIMCLSTMTLYDYFLLEHIKVKMPFVKVWKISCIANSFNNFLSFAGLTGASLRTLLYKKNGVKTKEAVYSSVIIASSTTIGVCFACWLVLLNVLNTRQILREYDFLWIGVLIFAIYLPLYYFIYEWKWLKKKFMPEIYDNNMEPKEIRIKIMAASLLEWFSITILFWSICRLFTHQVGLIEAMSIITMSSVGAMMSFIPGGMGSFDLICLLGLRFMGTPPDSAMATLITYRLFYHVIPWVIGVVLGISEVIQKKYKVSNQ